MSIIVFAFDVPPPPVGRNSQVNDPHWMKLVYSLCVGILVDRIFAPTRYTGVEFSRCRKLIGRIYYNN